MSTSTPQATSNVSPLKLYTCGAMNDPSYGLPVIASKAKASKQWKPKGPFRFLDLPMELRQAIYEMALIVPYTIDLDPSNRRSLASRLQILYTSRQVHQEAYPIFYGGHVFRIFPTHPGYLNSKEPILMKLPRPYRRAITTLELRLGPGWSKPPRCQSLSRGLWLKDCRSVRLLKVFVELDPSHDIFKGYRQSDTFYTVWASELFRGILHLVPSVVVVQFDAWPSVKKHDALMTALTDAAHVAGKTITWGPLRGWEYDEEQDHSASNVMRMKDAMAALVL